MPASSRLRRSRCLPCSGVLPSHRQLTVLVVHVHLCRPRWHEKAGGGGPRDLSDVALDVRERVPHSEYKWRSKLVIGEVGSLGLHRFASADPAATESHRLRLTDTWENLKKPTSRLAEIEAGEVEVGGAVDGAAQDPVFGADEANAFAAALLEAATVDSDLLNVRTFRPEYVPRTGSEVFALSNELEVDPKKIASSQISFYSKRSTGDHARGRKLMVLFSLEGAKTSAGQPEQGTEALGRDAFVAGDQDCFIKVDPKQAGDESRASVSVQAIAWWTGEMHGWPIKRFFQVCNAPEVTNDTWSGVIAVEKGPSEKNKNSSVVYAWEGHIPVYPVRAGTNSIVCLMESADQGTVDLDTATNAVDADEPPTKKSTVTLMAFCDGCLPSPAVTHALEWSRLPTPTITLGGNGEFTIACDDKDAVLCFCINGTDEFADEAKQLLLDTDTDTDGVAGDGEPLAIGMTLEEGDQLEGKPVRCQPGDRWRLWAQKNAEAKSKNLFLLRTTTSQDGQKVAPHVVEPPMPISHEGDVMLQAVAYRRSDGVSSSPCRIYLPSLPGSEHVDARMCRDPKLTIDYRSALDESGKVKLSKKMDLVLSGREDGSTIYWRVKPPSSKDGEGAHGGLPSAFKSGPFDRLDTRPPLQELFNEQDSALSEDDNDRIHMVLPDQNNIDVCAAEDKTIELRAYKPGRLPSDGVQRDIPDMSVKPPAIMTVEADGTQGKLVGSTRDAL